MKKTHLIASLLIITAVLVTACAPTAQEETLLTVGEQAYTRSELEALGTISVDFIDKDNKTTTYEGVLLSVVLENARLTSAGSTVIFIAADGYKAEMPTSKATVCENCIIAFDADSLRMVMPEQSGKLQVKDVISITVQ